MHLRPNPQELGVHLLSKYDTYTAQLLTGSFIFLKESVLTLKTVLAAVIAGLTAAFVKYIWSNRECQCTINRFMHFTGGMELLSA